MLALSSTSKWCKEERASPVPARADSVGLGRYFLLNHVGLSYLIYGLMLARSSPTTCWPSPCVVLSPLWLHVAAITPLYLHCISLSQVVTTEILTASQGPQHNMLFWSTALTELLQVRGRHQTQSVFDILYYLYIKYHSCYLCRPNPCQLSWPNKRPFDGVTAGAGGSSPLPPPAMETWPG